MKNGELKAILIARDGAYCEICCFPRTPLDLHHFLIHDSKRFHDILTVEENCAIVCRDCHGHLNAHKDRKIFLLDQIDKYGIDRMRKFWETIPDQLKKHNDYLWIGDELK